MNLLFGNVNETEEGGRFKPIIGYENMTDESDWPITGYKNIADESDCISIMITLRDAADKRHPLISFPSINALCNFFRDHPYSFFDLIEDHQKDPHSYCLELKVLNRAGAQFTDVIWQTTNKDTLTIRKFYTKF